jgi:hypothetical protein
MFDFGNTLIKYLHPRFPRSIRFEWDLSCSSIVICIWGRPDKSIAIESSERIGGEFLACVVPECLVSTDFIHEGNLCPNGQLFEPVPIDRSVAAINQMIRKHVY